MSEQENSPKRREELSDVRKFEELSEAEIGLRNLIFAVEAKDDVIPEHPFPMGDLYLAHILGESKRLAKKLRIPLVQPER